MNNLWCTNYSSVRTNTRFTVYTTTTAAATTGPAGTYFTTTFTNDLALILIKKIKKTEMSRQTNNNKQNHMFSVFPNGHLTFPVMIGAVR